MKLGNVRRLVAGAVAAMTAASLWAVPAAAKPQPPTGDAAEERVIDFNNLTVKDDLTGIHNAAWWKSVNWRKDPGATKGVYHVEGIPGNFGKAADDRVLKAYNDPYKDQDTKPNESADDPMQQVIFTNDVNDEQNLTVSNGQFYELSFDIATGEEIPGMQLRVRWANQNPQPDQPVYLFSLDSGKLGFPFLNNVEKDGSVNRESNYYPDENLILEPQRWYNLCYIFRSGVKGGSNDTENWCWVYLNGHLVASDKFVVTDRRNMQTLDNFTGIRELVFCHTPDSNYGVEMPTNREMYLDNLKLAKYNTMPQRYYSKTLDWNGAQVTDGAEDPNSDNMQTQLKAVSPFWGGRGNAVNFDKRDRPGHKGAIVSGVFGRPEGDRSIKLWRTAADVAGYDSLSAVSLADERTTTNNYEGRQTVIEPTVQKGDYYEVEFYMAWDGASDSAVGSIKGLQSFYVLPEKVYQGDSQVDAAYDGKMNGTMMEVRDNGILYVMSNRINQVLDPQKWYKFNMVFHAGDNKTADKNWYKFYVDDQLVVDKTEFVPKGRGVPGGGNETFDTFQGMYRFWLQQQSDKKTSNLEGVYFDDFTVSVSDTEPTYTPVEINTGEDAVAARYLNGTLDAYTDSRVQNANGWTVTNGEIAWANGFSSQNPHNYATITRQNGDKLYLDVKHETVTMKDIAFTETFPSNDLHYDPKPKYCAQNMEAGLYGKAAGDYVVKMENDLTQYDQGDSSISLMFPRKKSPTDSWEANQLEGYSVWKPTTFEASVLADGKFNSVNFNVQQQDASGINQAEKSMFVLKPDGTITGPDSTVIGRYRMGQWVRLSVTVYPLANFVELYINGEDVYHKAAFDTANGVARMKLSQAISKGTGTGILLVDDVRAYQGSVPDRKPTELGSIVSGMNVYNTGNVIFMNAPSQLNLSDTFTANATNVANVTVYKSQDLGEVVEDLDPIEDGAVLVAKNSDGTVWHYYYMAAGKPAPAAAVIDPAEVTKGGNVSVKLNVYKPAAYGNVKVFLAQYDAEQALLDVDVATVDATMAGAADGVEYSWPVTLEGVTLEGVSKNANADTVKLLVFQESNLYPLLSEPKAVQ